MTNVECRKNSGRRAPCRKAGGREPTRVLKPANLFGVNDFTGIVWPQPRYPTPGLTPPGSPARLFLRL